MEAGRGRTWGRDRPAGKPLALEYVMFGDSATCALMIFNFFKESKLG